MTERPARFLPGLHRLVLCIVVLLAGVALAVQMDHDHGGTKVSNLPVVLCSEQATQPIVNTGTLCQ